MNKFLLGKKKLYISLGIMAVLLLVGMLAVQYTMLRILQKNSGDMLIGRAFSSAALVENRIQRNYDALSDLGYVINPDGQVSNEKVDFLVHGNNHLAEMKYIGAVTVTGRQLYGVALPVNDNRLLTDTIRGNKNAQFIKFHQSEQGVLMTVPVWRGDKVAGIVYGILTDEAMNNLFMSATKQDSINLCLSSDFKNILLASGPDEESYTVVSDMMNSRYKNELDNLFQRLYYQGFGVVRIHSQAQDYYMAATALQDMKGWYIASVIPAAQSDVPIRNILVGMSVVYMLLALMFLAAFYTIYQNGQRNRLAVTRLAYEDSLTGLMNRAKLELDYQAETVPARPVFAIIMIDEFYAIDSSMGHTYAKEMLIELSRYLKQNIQAGEGVYYLQHNQFVLWLQKQDSLQPRLEGILAGFIKQVKTYPIRLSCGVRILTEPCPLESVLEAAYLAGQLAQRGKGSRIVFYDDMLADQAQRSKRLAGDFAIALLHHDIIPFLQPVWDTTEEKWIGCEALARWMNPYYGCVYPREFIPLLAANEEIVELDHYMVSYCCRIIRRWLNEGRQVLPVSINLSSALFLNKNLIQELKTIVNQYHIPCELLEFEVQEQPFSHRVACISEKVHELQKMGFRVSIDNFGTGDSLLTALQEIRASKVKLDPYFIQAYEETKDDQLIKDIVALAEHLDYDVLIKGIETEEQAKAAEETGCRAVQGYYYAKPMPIEQYEHLILKRGDEE